MKKLYIFSFLLILSSNNIFSQSGWFWNYPYPQGNNLLSILFINSNTGFAVGNLGTIIKTTNGGSNWININNFTNRKIRSISNIDSSLIIACGTLGAIYISTNLGVNWNEVNSQFTTDFNCVKCLNMNNILIVGNSGLIIKTTNLGGNWSLISSGITNNLKSINFLNQDIGLITAGSKILKTINSGDIWTQYNLTSNYNIYNICFIDSLTLYGAGDYQHFPSPNGILFKSTNGGVNWNTSFSYGRSSCNIIKFLNSSTGFAAGEGGIMWTTNSGLNWSFIYTVNSFYGSDFNINNCFMVGDGGSMYKSTNVGINWLNLSGNTNSYGTNIYFANQSVGFVFGSDSLILRTTNSGIDWITIRGPGSYVFSMCFTDINTGYAVKGENKVYKTVNSGLNWQVLQTGSSSGFRFVNFINDNTGFAAGYNSTIFKTTNAGNNWSEKYSQPSGTIYSLSFVNNNVGYGIYARYGLIKTTNGGDSWFYLPYINEIDNADEVYFLNENTGFIKGIKYSGYPYRILKTTNGGLNWQIKLSVVNVLNYFKINNSVGYLVGDNGLIMKSTNIGENWYQQNSITDNNLTSVHIINDSNVFISGYYNSIIKTTNGGGNFVNGISTIASQIPQSFSLHQNYPNPFNPITKIKFAIPSLNLPLQGGDKKGVLLKIYDLLGREITTLVNEQLKPGTYEVDWDGTGFASGVYFYSLVTERFVETKRMVLIK